MVRDADGTIREVSADEAQRARSEYASVLRVTSEIIGGTVRIDLDTFERLPFSFIQALNIHRKFIAEQSKDDGQ